VPRVTSEPLIAVCNIPGLTAFFGQNQNLRISETPYRLLHKFVNFGRMNTSAMDSYSYDVGLSQYLIIFKNIYDFSK
jgi:hypothetical protein